MNNSQSVRSHLLAFSGVVVALLISRWIPHPPNVTLLVGLSLWASRWIKPRSLALAAPVLALFLSDIFLGFHSSMIAVYFASALIVGLGIWMNRESKLASQSTPSASPGWLRVGGFTMMGSALFFLVTNLGVWAFSGMYDFTISGLAACFMLALPFWGNQLLGDLIVSISLLALDGVVLRRNSALLSSR